jgi:putative transcriptional regulator
LAESFSGSQPVALAPGGPQRHGEDMNPIEVSSDLTGKLLIAMPGMGDPRFETSVVFLCAHSDEGAMGLMINKPADGLDITDVLAQLDIEPGQGDYRSDVHFGGPVEHRRGFVLHSPDRTYEAATLEVDTRFAMTASREVLDDMVQGTGPHQTLLALGYAGWGPGQLEDEIGENAWLTCDAKPEIVFDAEDGGKWEAAVRSLGIEPLMLSGKAGHA